LAIFGTVGDIQTSAKVFSLVTSDIRQYRTPADKHGYQREVRGLGGSRAAVGRVWDCKVADPGVVTRRARDCGRRGLPGDRLYRTGSGLVGQAGYPGMWQW